MRRESARSAATASQDCCTALDCAAAPLYPDLTRAASLFKALADETRLAILRQLRDQGEVCVCNLLACCALAQPTVSHHLKVLREAGLVRAEKRGLWVYYSLDREKLAALSRLLP